MEIAVDVTIPEKIIPEIKETKKINQIIIDLESDSILMGTIPLHSLGKFTMTDEEIATITSFINSILLKKYVNKDIKIKQKV